MTEQRLRIAAELAGLVCLVIAGWLILPALGIAVAGIGLILRANL